MTRSKNNITQTFKETYEALLGQLNDPAVFQLYAEMTMKHVMVTRELSMVHNKQVSQDKFTCVLIYDGPSSVAPSAAPPPPVAPSAPPAPPPASATATEATAPISQRVTRSAGSLSTAASTGGQVMSSPAKRPKKLSKAKSRIEKATECVDGVINENSIVCHLLAMSCPSSQEVVVYERRTTVCSLREFELTYNKYLQLERDRYEITAKKNQEFFAFGSRYYKMSKEDQARLRLQIDCKQDTYLPHHVNRIFKASSRVCALHQLFGENVFRFPYLFDNNLTHQITAQQFEVCYQKFKENADIFKATFDNINNDPEHYSPFKQLQN
ncbi:hypothetical protein PS15p_203145 [Mucor circinelloides]